MTIEHRYSGSGSDEWGTPQDLWDALNAQYHFNIDLAASPLNAKCPVYYSREHSFLDVPALGLGVAWINPPFSQAGAFFEKVGSHSMPTVGIYRADNPETRHWGPIWEGADWLLFLSKRVQYVRGGTAPGACGFASTLVGWRCDPPKLVPEAGLTGVLVREWSRAGLPEQAA